MHKKTKRPIAAIRPNRFILGLICKFAAQNKTNQHSRSTNQNMGQVGRKLCPQIERGDTLDENAPIQVTLPKKETDEAIKAIDDAKGFEVKSGRACRIHAAKAAQIPEPRWRASSMRSILKSPNS